MLAYEKALDWQEMFDLALQQQIGSEDLVNAAFRLGGIYRSRRLRVETNVCILEDLCGKKRYQDAARVLLDYAQDVREAVIALVQGNLFSEARRIVSLAISSPLQPTNWSIRSHFEVSRSYSRKLCIQEPWTVGRRLRKT